MTHHTRTTPRLGSRRRAAPGFTLLEAILAIVIIGVMAGATVPIMTRLAEAMRISRRVQENSERVAFAMDRTQRFLRDLSIDQNTGELQGSFMGTPLDEITNGNGDQLYSMTTGMIKFSNSSIVNSALLYPKPGETIAIDIVPLTVNDTVASTMQTTHYFSITITLDGFSLHSYAFPRAKLFQR